MFIILEVNVLIILIFLIQRVRNQLQKTKKLDPPLMIVDTSKKIEIWKI